IGRRPLDGGERVVEALGLEDLHVGERPQHLLEHPATAALIVDDEDLHATSTPAPPARGTRMSVWGTEMTKRVSPPARSGSMVQPCARTMRWVMASPRPVPRGLVVYQGANTLAGSPVKPGPVSHTVSRAPSGAGAQRTPTTPASPAASRALEIRFTST